MKVRCLSIRQPWAWHIVRPDITDPAARVHAIAHDIIKTLENRSRRTGLRGGFLVHAAQGMTEGDYWCCAHTAADALAGKKMLDGSLAPRPTPKDAPRGGIVGYANLYNCVEHSTSPWYMGEYGYILKDNTPLPFLPCKGMLGFFWVEVPDDYLPAHLHEGLMS